MFLLSSFGHPTREGAAAIVLGSDEGVLYKARIYDKPGIYEQIAAHGASLRLRVRVALTSVLFAWTSMLCLRAV